MPVTLLAVDDSVTMRKVLEMTFAGEDYRVVTADSADSALALARAERPAVVLADATLEGKTGYDLCQSLKRDLPQVPVLVLSSKLHPYDPAKGQAAHVDDHIDKPFDTQQLIDKVRALTSAPAQASPKPPAVATTARAAVAPAASVPTARPAPAPAPAAAATRPAAAPAQPAAAAARVSPQANLRQTIQYPAASTSPTRTAKETRPIGLVPAQPAAQTRPAPAPPPSPAPPPTPQPTPTPAAVQPRAAAPAAPATPAAPPAQAAVAVAPAPQIAAIVEGDMGKKLAALGLSKEQIEAVLALSHEVVERVVWEVVPVLAETMIKEELQRLTAD